MASRHDKLKAERRALKWFIPTLFTLIVLIILPMIWRAPDLNVMTLCPKKPSENIAQATSFIIDITDRIEGMTKSDAVTYAVNIAMGLKKYERFSIFVLKSEKASELIPIFSMCSPGEPTFADRLKYGRKELENILETKFISKIRTALEKHLRQQSGSKASPIIETIRDVSKSQYWSVKNRLFLMSDLMENSAITSLYDDSHTFRHFKKSGKGPILDTIDLSQTVVAICPIYRAIETLSPSVQTNAMLFWDDFFKATKAKWFEKCCPIAGLQCPKVGI